MLYKSEDLNSIPVCKDWLI